MTTSPAPPRPAIVCLCGSTRFADEFNRQRIALTHAGQIVLSIEIVTTQAPGDDPQHADPWLKARLDTLHKCKIDLADYVLVLNVGQYIGPSTRTEIDYAIQIGKPVRYLEPGEAACWAISMPWSQVIDLRRFAGMSATDSMMPSRTAPASLPSGSATGTR